ncbi:MAG: bifunctional methylenetetrahydrofolate dehydrogenase/methenyltetrahydrofolate cyclohydrolase FolD [Enterobacterales bacterium]|nr:bifunctional methylenetetrahydrofolate dehydrogenase/methenyltetrahydrofolate cyclohydrolase FolD [Enterobacterales bacterium]
MATIISGLDYSQIQRDSIKARVTKLRQKHSVIPGLAVILVGEDPASQVYVRNKAKQTLEVGMKSVEHLLPKDTDEATLVALIEDLNQDQSIHGILVQLPLPDHIDEALIINSIQVKKDVDGFHLTNIGLLSTGSKKAIIPCTPLGCMMMLKDQMGSLSGKKAVVVGRSNIVGKPMAALLVKESCTVTITHSRTKNLEQECRQADILVAAVGRPEMIKGDWIKPGATVIDVGINRIDKEGGGTKLVGDVEFASASKVAAAITPVPGGVGPMTIACLLENTYQQACRINGIAEF